MTTIAYKDGVIAGDTLMSNGDEYQTGIRKIGRSKYFLFGYCGRLGGLIPSFDWLLRFEGAAEIRRMEDFYKFADELFVDDDDATIMIADVRGRVVTMSGGGYIAPHPRGWEAMGSGGTYAVGAMMCGRTSTGAVDIAMKLDLHTGGDIVHLQLDQRDNTIIRPGLIDS